MKSKTSLLLGLIGGAAALVVAQEPLFKPTANPMPKTTQAPVPTPAPGISPTPGPGGAAPPAVRSPGTTAPAPTPRS
jgi:hypothetical protein